MSVIFVCAGGALGLMSALIAFSVGLDLLPTFALWSATGTAFTLMGLTTAMMPRQEPARVTRRL